MRLARTQGNSRFAGRSQTFLGLLNISSGIVESGRARLQSCRIAPKGRRASAPEGRVFGTHRVLVQPKFLPIFVFLLLISFAQTGQAATQAKYLATVSYQQPGDNSGGKTSLSQQLVKESREAAGEDDQSQFKHSPSVQQIGRASCRERV
jgi:hypothetical protein